MADNKTAGKTAEAAENQAFAMGNAFREGGQRMAENTSAVSSKLIDQAEENTREAFGAMRAAANAKSVSEVMRIQADYMREQGARGLAQAREVGEMIMRFGNQAAGQDDPKA